MFFRNTDTFFCIFSCFEWGRIWKAQSINKEWNIMENHVLIVFPWPCSYDQSQFDANFQVTGNFSQNRGFFLKLLAKHRTWYVNVHRKITRAWFHIIFHIPFINNSFQNFGPFMNKKIHKSCWYLVKTTLSVDLILRSLIFLKLWSCF